jgi:glyoxylase-like metal-dependent hydrolase (beta-lactamase superfamily II)
MAPPKPPIFDTSFAPIPGEAVEITSGLARITAPNSSPFTFTGTNTFLVGSAEIAILDPGPMDQAHLDAIERAVAGRPVSAIILTHTHRDHSDAARSVSEKFGAPIWFGGPHRLSRPLRPFEFNRLKRSGDWGLKPARTLVDGETITAGDIDLTVHATPGHCANHVAFGLAGTEILLSGDHVMGWNSTLVSVPDGSMADYLASLDKVIALPYRHYHPAHGGPIADGPAHAAALKAHRQLRNEQVLAAVHGGARTLGAVVDSIYPTQNAKIRMAARMTITAHVEYLESQGALRVRRGIFGLRLLPA